MSIFQKDLRISLPWLVFGFFLALIAVCWLLFTQFRPANQLWADPGGPLFLIVAGLIPGLVVALGQYCLSWFEFKEVDRLHRLKIKRILIARDDEEYYRRLIAGSKERIMVLGVTASRFLDDFAAEESNRPDKKVLIDALNRKVKVQLLVADGQYLSERDRNEKLTRAERRLKGLQPKYPHLELKYYKHQPTHSMVVVDSDCLLGPIFPNVDSKDTPAIHTSLDSPFAKSYLDYFEHEWKAT